MMPRSGRAPQSAVDFLSTYRLFFIEKTGFQIKSAKDVGAAQSREFEEGAFRAWTNFAVARLPAARHCTALVLEGLAPLKGLDAHRCCPVGHPGWR
jgi:hypothetical protein